MVPGAGRKGPSAALSSLRVSGTVSRCGSKPLDTQTQRDAHRDVHESQEGAADGRTDQHAPSQGREHRESDGGRNSALPVPRDEAEAQTQQDQRRNHRHLMHRQRKQRYCSARRGRADQNVCPQ